MKKIFLILLCLIATTVVAAPPGHYGPYDPGAVRSDLTNIASGSALGVANGGTGKTTAAEALAALGGASLNGSSTVAFHASIYNAATGTAAAPAYSFGSDPDTGIYSAGADTIGFGEGGAESMRITSGGNVLIATSTDDGANKLQVNGAAKITGLVTAPKWSIPAGAQHNYVFGTDGVVNGFFVYDITAGGSHRAAITDTGNVLIGTTTDDGANKLQVNGSMRLIGGAAPTATEGAIYFNSTDKHFYGYNGTAWVQLDN